MNLAANRFGLAFAPIAFVLCAAGGLNIVFSVGFDAGLFSGDDNIWFGIGLYFLGKAFFVGPMLVISSAKPVAN